MTSAELGNASKSCNELFTQRPCHVSWYTNRCCFIIAELFGFSVPLLLVQLPPLVCVLAACLTHLTLPLLLLLARPAERL